MTTASATKLRTEAAAALRSSLTLGYAVFGSGANQLTNTGDLTAVTWTPSTSLTVTHHASTDGVTGQQYERVYQTKTGTALYVFEQFPAVALSTAGSYTASLDVHPQTGPCLALAIWDNANSIFKGVVFYDYADRSAHVGGAGSQTAYGTSLFASSADQTTLWMRLPLSAAQYYYRIYPTACPSGGPYTIVDTQLGDQYVANPSVALGTPGTLSNPQRVFEGKAGFIGARNRGRLPFFEVWVETQDFGQENREGGTVTSRLVVRVHATGVDQATIQASLDLLSGLSVGVIRNMLDSSNSAPNYAYDGNTTIGEMTRGPISWFQDVAFTVGHSYGNDNFGVV